MFVGVHSRSRRGVRRHELVQGRLVGRRHGRGADPSGVAVAGPDHRGLANRAASGPPFLSGVLVAFLAAEIGLVDFDRPGPRIRPFVPGLADPMGQVPGRGLPDAEVAMQLWSLGSAARHLEESDEAGQVVLRDTGVQTGSGISGHRG